MTVQYATQIKIFMKRFDCACKRIIKLKQPINVNKRVGYHVTSGIDNELSKVHKYYVQNSNAPISPFALLLFGTRLSKKGYPLYALEEKIGLPTCSLDPFVQGFTNAYEWEDVWKGLTGKFGSTKYYQSLMFNLGRAFLAKFCGIELPYILPDEYCNFFKNLG